MDDVSKAVLRGGEPCILRSAITHRLSAGAYHSNVIAQLVTQALLAHPNIELALLFGSQASAQARADSDVDVAVLAARPLHAEQRMALVNDLAQATGLPVDLVDLRAAGEPLLGQILAHGRRLIGSDEAQAELLRRHLVDAADFLPYVRRMLQERRRAWIGL